MEENKETGGGKVGVESYEGKEKCRERSGAEVKKVSGGSAPCARRARFHRCLYLSWPIVVLRRWKPEPPPPPPPLLLELICWTAHGRGKNSPRGSGRGRGKSSLTNLQRAQQRGDKPLSLRDQPAFHSQGWTGNREGSISLCWRCCLLSRARHRDEIFEEIASRFEGGRNRIFE